MAERRLLIDMVEQIDMPEVLIRRLLFLVGVLVGVFISCIIVVIGI